MRRALAIDEQAYGPDHPSVATRLNNLAGLLQATNRLAAAEPLYRRALAIDEQAYGPEHPASPRLNNLARLLQATNRRRGRAALSPHGSDLPSFRPTHGTRASVHADGFGKLPPVAQRLGCAAGGNRATGAAAMQTPGPLEPITPEVERLLGPAQPVQAVLAALAQYQQAKVCRPTSPCAASRRTARLTSLDQPIVRT